MRRWVTKQEILNLVKDKHFNNEDEFRDYIAPLLCKLFGLNENQIEKEAVTTSFNYDNSNRADIIIKTDDNFKKAIIVIELKLSRNIDNFKQGIYKPAVRQLTKYSQDTRAPYGILLTEDFCAIFRNKYFSYNQEPKRVKKDKIPEIKRIEDKMALYTFLDFILYERSMKYMILLDSFILILGSIFGAIISSFGFIVGVTISSFIALSVGFIIAMFLIAFKVVD
jgi:hypothetical protein